MVISFELSGHHRCHFVAPTRDNCKVTVHNKIFLAIFWKRSIKLKIVLTKSFCLFIFYWINVRQRWQTWRDYTKIWCMIVLMTSLHLLFHPHMFDSEFYWNKCTFNKRKLGVRARIRLQTFNGSSFNSIINMIFEVFFRHFNSSNKLKCDYVCRLNEYYCRDHCYHHHRRRRRRRCHHFCCGCRWTVTCGPYFLMFIIHCLFNSTVKCLLCAWHTQINQSSWFVLHLFILFFLFFAALYNTWRHIHSQTHACIRHMHS